MIMPTVGRVVWFNQMTPGMFPGSDMPRAAIVAHVWSERLVNLTVFDANGMPHSRTSIQLVQEGDEIPTTSHCTWMPFQVGQAKAQTKPTDAQLTNRFMHHPPKNDQADRYTQIRLQVLETAKVIRDLTPVSPEQTRALNALDEAMMLANAAIARNE